MIHFRFVKQEYCLNTLTLSQMTKLWTEVFADNKINVSQIMIFQFDEIENIVGFQNPTFQRSLKLGISPVTVNKSNTCN